MRLYAALRALGARLVVVTGARAATLLGRLPYLPAADAYICEGGGRIFYPAGGAAAPAGAGQGQGLPTAAPLMEDLAWRARHAAAAGPAGQDGVPPERRAGSLWALYARLRGGGGAAAGLHLDAVSYTTAFRVKGPEAAVAAALAGLPEGLATAVNLGAADVFPATSGKVGCRGGWGWAGGRLDGWPGWWLRPGLRPAGQVRSSGAARRSAPPPT